MEREMKIPLNDEDRAMLKRSADADDRSMRQQAKHLIREALTARAKKAHG